MTCFQVTCYEMTCVRQLELRCRMGGVVTERKMASLYVEKDEGQGEDH